MAQFLHHCVLRAQRRLWSTLNLHIASISIDGLPGHFKQFINSKGWLLFSGITNALTKACLPFCWFSIVLEAFPYKLVIWIMQRKICVHILGGAVKQTAWCFKYFRLLLLEGLILETQSTIQQCQVFDVNMQVLKFEQNSSVIPPQR